MQLAEEKYRALERAAMVHPGNLVKMARLGGVSYNTAKKAWFQGLDGRLPLKDTIGSTVVEAGAGPGGSAVVHGPGAGQALPPPHTHTPAPVAALGDEAKAEAVRIVRALRANASMLNEQVLTLHQPTLELDQAIGGLLSLQAHALREKRKKLVEKGEVIEPEKLAADIHLCMKLHQHVSLSGKRAVETMRAVARVEHDLFGPGGLIALEEAEAARAKAATEHAEEKRLPQEQIDRELEWAREKGPPELRLVAGGSGGKR